MYIRILQSIEESKYAVDLVISLIERDNRHTDMKILESKKITCYLYEDNPLKITIVKDSDHNFIQNILEIREKHLT